MLCGQILWLTTWGPSEVGWVWTCCLMLSLGAGSPSSLWEPGMILPPGGGPTGEGKEARGTAIFRLLQGISPWSCWPSLADHQRGH